MSTLPPLESLKPGRFDTTPILKRLASASRALAELRGVAAYLINNLFMHPYTKIEFIERDLGVSRLTASKYLDALAAGGFVEKHKMGRSNYYVNLALNQILLG